jgi:peptide deformylase
MIDIPKALIPVWYSRDETRKVCRPVEMDDVDQIEPLVWKMVRYCRDNDGVGLAAPQVGIYVRLAISLAIPGLVKVLINPSITRFLGREINAREGCLSIPPATKNRVTVVRAETIHLECGTMEAPDSKVESVHSGDEARVISHEIDHLNGTFIIDRCSFFERKTMFTKFFRETRIIHARVDQFIEDHKILSGVK